MTEKTRITRRRNAQERYRVLKADPERYAIFLEKKRKWCKARYDRQKEVKIVLKEQNKFVSLSKIEELEQKLSGMTHL